MKKTTSTFNLSIFFFLLTFGLYAQNVVESECGTVTTPESQQYWENTKPTIKK